MRYVASVHMFDVMDQVWVSAIVRDSAGFPDGGTVEVLAMSDILAGVGEPDPRQWLLDALVGLIEAL